ncbi:uncharacterized protein An14g04050 [Aspergillus niger]|uniref:pyridoxal 5'-phosphate synthase n=2 Tax=Aspergillus niger TaxID=5061 RepID=A2R3E9_ASPNC|nr:uncharacterized protein An14g04050 [Aspergillus niger]CAK46641.1 unnamed protein product [Aspergillus niger]
MNPGSLPDGPSHDAKHPKKLIFAPGDIQTTPEPKITPTETPDPSATATGVTTAPAPISRLAAEALRSNASTPDSVTENEIVSHPARAHQFVSNPPLTISQMHPTNPLHQFHNWFRDPRLLPSSAPETCTLATASMPSGRVSARVVYLKELDERGWVVYSNWGTGLQEGNKWAALTFCWSNLERQVRIEGLVEPLSRDESEMYWRTRERGSQIGAWASWQSKVPGDVDATDIDDGRALLEKRVKEMEERFAGVEQIPLPPFWGGVRLVPESVEFWQGRRSRLHDRFRSITPSNTLHTNTFNMSEPQSPSQEPQSHPNPEQQQQQQQQQQKPHQTKWLLLALSSGAFAALNGLFAKL